MTQGSAGTHAPCTDRNSVTLVIPGRNVAPVIRRCLEAVLPLTRQGELREIIFVDDGSDDNTVEIVESHPVRYIKGEGRGPGAARNLGWQAATTPLVWFIDADCVTRADALQRLRSRLDAPDVVGVGGSYANMRPDSLLACIIHEEIMARHRMMPSEVDHVGSFNVLYRRDALEAVGGFDEGTVNCGGSAGAEDVELAFRLLEAGYRLRFEPQSTVGHYHPTRLLRYLRTQRQHGYWRVRLYLHHPRKSKGDTYAGLCDYLQPPLAVAIAATAPLAWLPAVLPWLWCGIGLLLSLQLPMAVRIRGSFTTRISYPVMSLVRAFWRGAGMVQGVLAVIAAPGEAMKVKTVRTTAIEPKP